MKRNIEIAIDLKNKIYNTIFLKQMDTTMFTVKILDNNVVTNLSEQTVDIIFTKPNDKIVQQLASNIDKENGIAIIPLKEDCVRQSGKAKMEIEVKNTNSEVISSFYIPIQIEKTSKENVESDDIPNYFEEFSKAIDNLKHNSDEMLKDISVAEEQRTEAEKGRTEKFNQIVKELDLTKYENRLEELESTQNEKINKLQKDFKQKRYYLTLEEDLEDNSELVIPCLYKVR